MPSGAGACAKLARAKRCARCAALVRDAEGGCEVRVICLLTGKAYGPDSAAADRGVEVEASCRIKARAAAEHTPLVLPSCTAPWLGASCCERKAAHARCERGEAVTDLGTAVGILKAEIG